MSQEELSEAGQDSPSPETTDADGSAESPFKLYDGAPASPANTHRSSIPQPRPEGQPSNFGTPELRPKLSKSQSEDVESGSDTDDGQSESIMKKVREAGKLATEGHLDSAKAIEIIEQIRALAAQEDAE